MSGPSPMTTEQSTLTSTRYARAPDARLEALCHQRCAEHGTAKQDLRRRGAEAGLRCSRQLPDGDRGVVFTFGADLVEQALFGEPPTP